LIHADGEEIGELNLRDGAHTGDGGASRRANDDRLGDRRIPYPVFPELVDHSDTDAEGAPVDADILAHEKHVVALAHLLAHRLTDRFGVGDFPDAAGGFRRGCAGIGLCCHLSLPFLYVTRRHR
jgi:hypothetical protein